MLFTIIAKCYSTFILLGLACFSNRVIVFMQYSCIQLYSMFLSKDRAFISYKSGISQCWHYWISFVTQMDGQADGSSSVIELEKFSG